MQPANRRPHPWAIAIAATLALALVTALWLWQLSRQTSTRLTQPERLQCPLPQQPTHHQHAGMVWVPGGDFTFGDTVYPEEQPLRKKTVAGFWMDRTEVSNEQFAQFVRATGYVTVAERPVDAALHSALPPEMRQPGAVVFVMPSSVSSPGKPGQWWRYVVGAQWRHPGGPGTSINGRGAFPVVAVTHADALAYARWKGTTLPSEVQWEWAARGAQTGAALAAHDQPAAANTWQGLFPVANSGEDGFVGLAPVGCYAPNGVGLFDMIGNVWELTADRWTPDHSTDAPPESDPAPFKRPFTSAQQVIKGGSFLCAPNYCMRYRAGARQAQEEDLAASHLGFRTILLAAPP